MTEAVREARRGRRCWRARPAGALGRLIALNSGGISQPFYNARDNGYADERSVSGGQGRRRASCRASSMVTAFVTAAGNSSRGTISLERS